MASGFAALYGGDAANPCFVVESRSKCEQLPEVLKNALILSEEKADVVLLKKDI